jgi:hypothetical protein
MSNIEDLKNDETQIPKYSASLEGAENILITKIFREATVNGYGLISFEDSISVTNFNNNPITSILIGISLNRSEDLVFFETIADEGNTLFTERSYMVMKDYEMFAIYFESPLLPHQTKSIKFMHQYKNQLSYIQFDKQYITYSGLVYPVLPYRAEEDIKSIFYLPARSDDLDSDWGLTHGEPEWIIRYDIGILYNELGGLILTPFMENLNEKKIINFSFSHEDFSEMEINEITREIFISPWGIMRVKDELSIVNLGTISYSSVSLDIPFQATRVIVSDDLGELDADITSLSDPKKKTLDINFLTNRIRLLPNTTYQFKIEYHLPFEEYFSFNWFQESIQLDILTTKFSFLGRHQTIKIIIDGSNNLNYISEPPEAIEKSGSNIILTYESDYVTPLEQKIILFTFTIDLFDLLLRPIIFMLLISIIASIYVLTIKSRKKEHDMTILKREFIPVNEIRECFSLRDTASRRKYEKKENRKEEL